MYGGRIRTAVGLANTYYFNNIYMGGAMKYKATLRLTASGEVVGEVVNEHGNVVSSRHFGVMTEDEFRKGLKQVENVFSGVASTDAIEPSEPGPPFWRAAAT